MPSADFITALHSVPWQAVLVTTGGGATAVADLLSVPGASALVLAAHTPYCEAALVEYLGARPEGFCTERTARLMAMAAWSEARRLAAPDRSAQAVGVACTAGLASARPKRGPHRAHVALQTTDATHVRSLELTKGARTRAEEERVTSDLLLDLMAEVAGVTPRESPTLLPDEAPVTRFARATDAARDVLLGVRPFASPRINEGLHALEQATIFPGSFNPPHAGHREMARIASARTGRPAFYEIALTNVDKPPLDYLELAARTTALTGEDYVLTAAPTFAEKGALFPGAMFVVGIDTLRRIADPRYSAGDVERMMATIRVLGAQGCRFLVFGRVEADDRFQTLADENIPPELRALCIEVPESEFRVDVSSTSLRQANDENAAL